MKSVTLKIFGMTCKHCVRHVTTALEEVYGVTDVKVDLETNSAQLVYDEDKVSMEDLAETIQEAGYSVEE
jgi:P-type Cu+ transporter